MSENEEIKEAIEVAAEKAEEVKEEPKKAKKKETPEEKIVAKMSEKDDGGRKIYRQVRFIKKENGKAYYEIDELKGKKVVATKKRVQKIT
jgi:hypothetical protein